MLAVLPERFGYNPETAVSNRFQARPSGGAAEVAAAARSEAEAMYRALDAAGIQVLLLPDAADPAPDAVFPNNWFSTHPGGHVAVYPMYSANRRRERRSDVLELLKAQYRVQDVIDYSGLEADGVFLEGTGAMVLDHIGRIAYTAQSNRADPVALERFCTHFNYEPMAFATADGKGQPCYHTNVMLALMRDGFHPDSAEGTVELRGDGSPVLDYRMTDYTWDGIRRAFHTMADIQFAAGAKAVLPLHADAGYVKSAKEAHALIDGLSLELYRTRLGSAHVMGGCAMGEDPKQAVCAAAPSAVRMPKSRPKCSWW